MGGPETARKIHTLKRKCMTSPSCTTYSLPSSRSFPASRAPDFTAVANVVVVGDHFGADESVLEIRVDDPAACGAVLPRRTVQARTSLGPAVK